MISKCYRKLILINHIIACIFMYIISHKIYIQKNNKIIYTKIWLCLDKLQKGIKHHKKNNYVHYIS